MKRKNKIIASLIIIIILATIFISNIPLNKETIPSQFILGENMGFDLTPGKLNFGQIIPGYTATREITIDNNFDETIKIKIKSSGEISNNIIVSENNFLLNPSESKAITFTAYSGDLTELREYNGKIIIISKKA